MYFGNYRLGKTSLDQCVKSTVSERPLTVNMLKGPKYLYNLHGSTFTIFFITLGDIDKENVSLSVCKILGYFVNTLTAEY